MRTFFRVLALASVLFLCACQKMESTEYGVRFRKLPTFFFGGVASKVIAPGETTPVLPWDSIYRFDTSIKDLSWGRGPGEGGAAQGDDLRRGYVHTRALDGNEVALAMTIRYRVLPDPEKLRLLVTQVTTSDEGVQELVSAVGRADMRTAMNALTTDKFLDEAERYRAVDAARAEMQRRLEPLGIEILRVNLDDFRFERVGRDGTVDTSYQDKLTEIQKLHQDTEREGSRIATVKAKKAQELNNAAAVVNRQVAEADGYKAQAMVRGDSYYEAKSNEAEALLAAGKAEVTGIIERIAALSGPGGEAILRLELARHLLQSNPQFVLMGEGGGNSSMEVRRVDTNELLQQMGLLDALRQDSRTPAQDARAGAGAGAAKVVTKKEGEK